MAALFSKHESSLIFESGAAYSLADQL